jgi:uncharacterized membrane protein
METRRDENQESRIHPERQSHWDQYRRARADMTSPSQTDGMLSGDRLAQALGWFSVGLGLAAVTAPRRMSRMIGLGDHNLLLRIIGLRELASGVGILTQRQPTGWLWSRVAGDIMDLALLRRGFENPKARLLPLSAATAAVAGVTALDVRCSIESNRYEQAGDEPTRIVQTTMISRPPQEIYNYWRNFENLPRFMQHIESVQMIDDKRSHWVARGPAGKRVEWDAELTEDRANESIAWSSPDSSLQHSGSVQFRPTRGGRGTLVRVEIEYRAPAGMVGSAVAKLSGRAPDQQIAQGLRRLKQLMEAGEILTTDGQPAGRARSTSWKYDHAVPRAESAAAARL